METSHTTKDIAMRVPAHRSFPITALLSFFLILTLGTSVRVQAADLDLIAADSLVVDKSLPASQRDAQILAARRYASFWNTGDAEFARQALDPDFVDRTPPAGRLPGLPGVLAASTAFRSAVPDLRCEVTQMIVAGDRVVTHLRFSGHFTGTLMGRQGQGQPIQFIATDIYRVKNGRIVENWHLEDNLSLLQQAGLVSQ